MQYISFVPALLIWWYGRGLTDLFSFLLALLDYIQNLFSVTVLLKTLFSPWKKMVGERGRGIDGLKIWLLDNLVSRGVGFVVRVLMIFVFMIAFLAFLIFSVIAIIFWLFMPGIVAASFIYIFIGK